METIRQNFNADTSVMFADITARLERLERLSVMAAKDVFTTEEAALYLGRKIDWLYKMTNHKLIPHYKNEGKRTYYKRADLDAWMCSRRIATNEEIEQEALNH